MPKFALYFNKSYAMEVEAASAQEAHDKAFNEFNCEEADSASVWEIDNCIDLLED
jgi:hypothetical protein